MASKSILALWLSYLSVSILTIYFVSSRQLSHSFEEKSLSQSPVQYDNKFFCTFNSSTKTSSTRRDVVLLFATGYASGLELCLKSLRSTGSQCTIVLFCSPDFHFTSYIERILTGLDIEVVRDCKETKGRKIFVPHMIRFEFELDWLLKHRNSVDRVFHTDSFDVFFQGDPFANIQNDTLTFVVEPHQIRSCGWNLAWLRECYGDQIMNSMGHRFIVCSGSVAGSSEHYIKLLKLMIDQNEWRTCYQPSKDQPILNYLIWNGLVEKAGIKYKLTGCDGGFFTVQWCVIEHTPLFNQHGQLVSTMNTVPSYVHQYNRLKPLTNYLFDICKVKTRF
ncbi:hypothetical protein TRFO_39552 [Tritrichomonas foetus]|uniref:Nucleotide-diphospho-sugar transferase domain-containing protein n=1 Tax=Tritrichomonas foetus TaxID=1144522 RepID=A0A1J4J9A1_9EUKA|nr:hypothetical protein TRFO_39552 [Tritrichomonas foetus]|eukprot:OHS94259.1 hypothetical protein TRFO_39552 [Tritrichomonas foetus]